MATAATTAISTGSQDQAFRPLHAGTVKRLMTRRWQTSAGGHWARNDSWSARMAAIIDDCHGSSLSWQPMDRDNVAPIVERLYVAGRLDSEAAHLSGERETVRVGGQTSVARRLVLQFVIGRFRSWYLASARRIALLYAR